MNVKRIVLKHMDSTERVFYRSVIPLHDIKLLVHFEKVSLLSKMPNNKIVQPDAEETKIKDNGEEHKAARILMGQKHPIQRTKYIEFSSDEDSTFEEVVLDNDGDRPKTTTSQVKSKHSAKRTSNYEESSNEESTSSEESSYEENSSSEQSSDEEYTSSEESSDEEKENTSSEVSSSEDIGDSSWSETESETFPKRVKTSFNNFVKKSVKSPLSKYEKMVEKNRAEAMEFLRLIKVDEAKQDLLKALNEVKGKRKEKKEMRCKVYRSSSR